MAERSVQTVSVVQAGGREKGAAGRGEQAGICNVKYNSIDSCSVY